MRQRYRRLPWHERDVSPCAGSRKRRIWGLPVTPLELLFDLVFVFAFTQVTAVLSDDPTWSGLDACPPDPHALWWAWASYAWLTNTVDPEDGAVWGAMLVAMAAMFIAALAVPEAFGSHGVLFGVAFLIVNLMHLTLMTLAGRGDAELRAAILRIAPAALVGSALIVAAGFADGRLRSLLWLAAVVIGLVTPLFTGLRGWSVQPAHFVERHGLIVIIAIGESMFAMGIGARGTSLDGGVIAAAVLGLAVATSFWLAYFDFFQLRAEQLLRERRGLERVALARDIFTYLHLPMVAGIVLFAFAAEVTLAHVGDELGTIPAFGLCGGPSLYLFSFVASAVARIPQLRPRRLVGAVAFSVLWPVAVAVPALLALALVTAVWVALHVYELVWWRDARAEARALRPPG